MYFKLYKRRFILLGIWSFLISLLIFIWFINYFIINILLYHIIFITCAEIIFVKIGKHYKIDDLMYVFFAIGIPGLIITYTLNFYDIIIFNIIFVICDLIIVVKIYYILFKKHSKFSFLRRG